MTTDKFRIDSHKYAFHPNHAAVVLEYLDNPTAAATEAYRNQHPLYIEVSPVGACNHRCTFCAVDYIGYKSNFLPYEHYKRSIDSMVGRGTKSIMFAGEGEPMLHPEIGKMVEYTKINGNIDTSFTTNGVHFNEAFAEEYLKYVSWVKVSFNAGNKDVYSKIHRTKDTDFDKVIQNLKQAVKIKKEQSLDTVLGFQTLLLPENRNTIHTLCEIAKDIGLDYVVVKPYSQHKLSKTTMYNDIDYSKYLDLEGELLKYNDENFNVVFRINTINNWISQNEARYCKCYATPSSWAYMMADGDVYSCSAYLLDKRFKLGSIVESSFDEIWSSDSRMNHSSYVLNDLDISECRVNCRMDQVNRYLDKIKNEKIPHMNFI